MQEMAELSDLIIPSARIALAAFLHDLGKFAERANIDVAQQTLENNQQLYCPHHKQSTDDKGWFSHKHAAYTAIALDELERYLPPLKGYDVKPFASWSSKDIDDSLINAAAKHHKPDTFLQWIVATADRVASGFERNEFDQYNEAKEGTATGKNHYTARQLTLFEQIRLHDTDREQTYRYRYKLMPLSPDALIPVLAEGYETDNRGAAQREYRELWNQFAEDLKLIPESHRSNLGLWLDHFESLWGCYTHAIPSATAFNIRPDVSLYDHSRTTAALAVALWRYHYERGDDPEQVTKLIRCRDDWDEQKLLLIQGDFFGVQDFIFASGGETQKRAAKLLRGRSFYVSLLTECAALKILDELGLPSTSQIINAAGKFLIVAPNTEKVRNVLKRVQQELDAWFLDKTYGVSGIGLADLPACCNDFLKRQTEPEGDAPFQQLMKKLFEKLERAKLQRFDLCRYGAESAVFSGFLQQFNEKGVCQIDGRSPAVTEDVEGVTTCELCGDQIKTGECLTKHEGLLITRKKPDHNNQAYQTLRVPVLGYYISFIAEMTGNLEEWLSNEGDVLRAFDFSLPQSPDGAQTLWKGYARRHINGYVSKFSQGDVDNKSRYKSVDDPVEVNAIKTLNHIACEEKGVNALMTLKGDVDSLGLIFQRGLVLPHTSYGETITEGMTFAKMAALSRQVNAFFTIYLPYRCQCVKEYRDTYTVFAGGDDFFLIGPWHSQLKLSRDMRQWFKEYVAHNPEVNFSAGLSMTRPGLPIRHLAEQSEHAIEKAKQYNLQKCQPAPKNAVTCYGHSVNWEDFDELLKQVEELESLKDEIRLSTSYLYGLLQFIDMQTAIGKNPENAIWHSWFAYRTRRMLERIRKFDDGKRRELQTRLADAIVHRGIEKYKDAYRIALFTYLYKHREEGQV